MNAPARNFDFKPAVRNRVSLIIAIAGASGGGKTLSALKMARGLAAKPGEDLSDPAALAEIDARIGYIDTEAGRALHYAVAPGEKPGLDRFAFQHGDLTAPFSPTSYAEAIKKADETGRFEVIVVDSVSHSYEGEGGLHDMHDQAVADAVAKARQFHNGNYAFDEQKAAEKASVGAWKEPKMLQKRFVSRLLQCRAHLILCLRADEKIRIEKVTEKGNNGREYTKTVIVQPKDMKPEERWVPICEKRFMYEMTLSLVVTPASPGVPIPIKLQQQHHASVPLDKTISEETGRALAQWARGGSIKSEAERPSPSTSDRPAPDAAADGAGHPSPPPVPSAEDYSGMLDSILDDATDAKELANTWTRGKDLRAKILWPDDEEDRHHWSQIKTRVGQKIEALKRSAS